MEVWYGMALGGLELRAGKQLGFQCSIGEERQFEDKGKVQGRKYPGSGCLMSCQMLGADSPSHLVLAFQSSQLFVPDPSR